LQWNYYDRLLLFWDHAWEAETTFLVESLGQCRPGTGDAQPITRRQYKPL